MCVYPHFFTFSRTRHATSRHPPPPYHTSSGMCQEGKEWCGGAKGCQPLISPFLCLADTIFVPPFSACPFLPPEPSSPSDPPYASLALHNAMSGCHGPLRPSRAKLFTICVCATFIASVSLVKRLRSFILSRTALAFTRSCPNADAD